MFPHRNPCGAVIGYLQSGMIVRSTLDSQPAHETQFHGCQIAAIYRRALQIGFVKIVLIITCKVVTVNILSRETR